MAGRFQLSRLQSYGVASTLIFVYTVLHAFRQRSNFYSAAVYLSKSNACMMILWNQGIYQTVLFGKLLQTILFGELRMIEVERLQERGWFAITETLLALTIFKDEFDSSFVLLFVSLLFLKVFHWLAGDRVELMEQSANIPRLFHLRMGALLSMLWVFDILLLAFAVESILIEGPTVMIMFASEYMILLAMVWSTSMKYGLNVIDLRSEVPWEDKSIYVFYVDLATDFFKLVTYVSFFGLILTFYGLPLNILRDVYLTFRSFILKCRDLRRYRQATRNMDSLYPNATSEEMERMVDKTCIICREDMEYRGPPVAAAPEPGVDGAAPEPAPPAPAPAPAAPRSGPNDTPKKLPCGHVFHFHCLRSWLERQQSCPTCRRPVLASDQARAQAAAVAAAGAGGAPRGAAAPPGGEDVVRQAQINLARNLGREAFAVVFPGIPFPAEAGGPAPPGAQAGLAPPPRDHGAGAGPRGAVPNGVGLGAAPIPGSTGTAAGARSTAGSGHDNPLARFSLPDHRLPPSGEAGLYAPGPVAHGHQPGWTGVAYGGYPSPGSSRSGQPVTAAQGSRVPNLEERLAHIRARMAQATAGLTPPAAVVPTPTPTPTLVVPQPTPTPTTPAAASSSSSADASTPVVPGAPTAPKSETAAVFSPRQAALEAAERRAGLASKPSTNGRAPPVTTTPPAPESKTGALPQVPSTPSPASTAPMESEPSLPAAPSTSTSTPASVPFPLPTASSTQLPPTAPSPSTSLSSTPAAFPRLIPLFSPDSPLATAPYPHLLASMPSSIAAPFFGSTRPIAARPLVPASPTEDQLRELSQLTRAGIEERLRVLVGFQDRMASLAADMGKVLSVLPPDTPAVPKAADSSSNEGVEEEEPRKLDKGKKPMEGLHAEVPVDAD